MQSLNAGLSNSSASILNEAQSTDLSNLRSQRIRKTPTWMIDYESGGELSDDDLITHFVLFTDCDPEAFEELVKETK